MQPSFFFPLFLLCFFSFPSIVFLLLLPPSSSLLLLCSPTSRGCVIGLLYELLGGSRPPHVHIVVVGHHEGVVVVVVVVVGREVARLLLRQEALWVPHGFNRLVPMDSSLHPVERSLRFHVETHALRSSHRLSIGFSQFLSSRNFSDFHNFCPLAIFRIFTTLSLSTLVVPLQSDTLQGRR